MRLTETDSRCWFPAGEGVGIQCLKRAMERNGGDDCTKMCLIPLNCALKMVKMVNSMFCVYHSKKKIEKKNPRAFRGSAVLI